MSRGSVVFDTLVLSSCGHPRARRLGDSERIVSKLEKESPCWRVLEEILGELDQRGLARCGPRGRSSRRVYVSDKGLENLRDLMRAVMECGRRSGLLIKLRYIYVAMSLYGPRQCVVEVKRVRREECDLSGYHAEEYCEVKEALRETLERCELLCAILCSGETFDEDHVLRLARDLGVEVSLREVVSPGEFGARVIEITKETSSRP